MKNKNTRKFIYLTILLITMLLNLGIGKEPIDEEKKIYKNIYVEEVNIGGMNKVEAIKAIEKKYNPKTIKLVYETKIWTISPENIDLKYSIEEAYEKAYKYTRSDNKGENIKKKISLNFREKHVIDLESTYNEAKLSSLIEIISKEIDIQVKNATINIKDSGEIVTTESKEGREVDVIKLKESIYDMIINHKLNDINLPVKIIYPTITTEQVKSINTVLGQYSTSFRENCSRGSNIHVAGESTSDRLIMPFEIFSYNKATGARTWHNGYKTAKVLVGGKYVNGEGGGVCQVSTTLYNAALLSGMSIEEVHNHSIPSRYAPRGRDATVSYGFSDFKFKNIHAHPIYIKNIVNNGSITSKIYGCSQDREKIYIKIQEKYDKDKIEVKTFRIYLDEENNKIREELVSESKYMNK